MTSIGFLLIGPYSYLAGAISLDFGGKQGASTASGFIDGLGYLGGMLAGDGMARVSVTYGWSGAFLTLAAVALLSSAVAVVFLLEQRRPAAARVGSRLLLDRRHEDMRHVECFRLPVELGQILVDQRL